MAALTGPTMSSETGDDMEDGSAIQQEDNMIDVKQVEGRVKASSVKRVGEIIERHPEEAVGILRHWMYQDAWAGRSWHSPASPPCWIPAPSPAVRRPRS